MNIKDTEFGKMKLIVESVPFENIEHCLTPQSKEIYITQMYDITYEYELGKFASVVFIGRTVPHIENVIPAAEVLVKKFTEGVEKGVYDFGTLKGVCYLKRDDGSYLVLLYPVLSKKATEDKEFYDSISKNGFIG